MSILQAVLLSLWLALAGPLQQPWAQPLAPRVHVVQPGETLAAIAAQYDVSVQAIVDANDITDPDLIYAGQSLVIPAPAGAAPANAISQPSSAMPAASTTRTWRVTPHAMRPREDLSSLARRLGLEPEQLLQANGPARAEFLLTEPEIRIPAPSSANLPPPFVQVAYTPTIVRGRTGVARVTLNKRIPPRARFNEQSLTFVYEGLSDLGHRYSALIPTDALLEPGLFPLIIEIGQTTVRREIDILPGDYLVQNIVLPPSKGGILRDRTRVREELTRVQKVWANVTPERLWRGPFRFPIGEGHVQTSPFGTRRSYNGGPVSSFHAGSDWAASEGAPILAPADGVIALADELFVRGGAVIIDHGMGVYSNFWHLSSIDVEPGQRVARGQPIGLVGTTGLSTGAHLHWELRINGMAVEPMQWTRIFYPDGLPLSIEEQ